VAVQAEPLSPEAAVSEVSRPEAGAVALFLGTARNHSGARTGITHLEYEAYPEQAEAKIGEILAEAQERWPLLAAVVEHRIGVVELGQPSVLVAVSAAHRGAAFEAARYLIDELKLRAPIWKKEHWPGGGEWVRGA
jgi:molybdopterin synthase catalytic subunit